MGKGRPPHKPTNENRAKAEALAQRGVPQELIAIALGISKDTLVKYYREELDRGSAHCISSLLTMAHERAKKSDTVLIFLCKTQAGLREKDPMQHAAPPPQIVFVEKPPSTRKPPQVVQTIVPNRRSADETH